MSPRKTKHPETATQKSKALPGVSQDRERHLEEAKYHPQENPGAHAPHKAQEKPTLPHRHYPHTQPPEYGLDIDHGAHEDRPRPGKLAKKSSRKGSPP